MRCRRSIQSGLTILQQVQRRIMHSCETCTYTVTVLLVCLVWHMHSLPRKFSLQPCCLKSHKLGIMVISTACCWLSGYVVNMCMLVSPQATTQDPCLQSGTAGAVCALAPWQVCSMQCSRSAALQGQKGVCLILLLEAQQQELCLGQQVCLSAQSASHSTVIRQGFRCLR